MYVCSTVHGIYDVYRQYGTRADSGAAFVRYTFEWEIDHKAQSPALFGPTCHLIGAPSSNLSLDRFDCTVSVDDAAG